MQLLFCPDNYIDGDEFVKLSDTELHSLVKPLGPYKKIRRLIPDLASADTSTSLGSTKAEQTLNSESKRSLSLVSQLKHAKATVFARKTVSSLFQASTSSKSERTFDPSAELAVSNEKRKKKSCTPKPLTITVVVLPYKQASVPKGKQRQTLEAQGRIRKVPIFRHASDAEVEEAIRTAFHGIKPPLHQWEVLDCVAKNRLCAATSKDGSHGLSAEHAIERRGGLYLAQLSDKVSTLIIMSIMHALAGACIPRSVLSHKVIVSYMV